MSEVWMEIEESPRYLVSSLGRVKNRMSGYVFAQNLAGNGYPFVKLMLGSIQIERYVHRLAAEAFYDGNHQGLEVNHIDGDKCNNCIWNLEWVTGAQNIQHAYDTRLRKPPGQKPIRIIETGEVFENLSACARHIGGYQANITGYLVGRLKHYKGYTFEYVEER